MNITTRKSHKFVELTVETSNTTVTTAFYKGESKEIESIIADLLNAADDLATYTDKTVGEYIEEYIGCSLK
jgi:hypothetical protein